MFKKLLICVALLAPLASAQTHTVPTLDRNNTWTGSNVFGAGFTLPIGTYVTCTSGLQGVHQNIAVTDTAHLIGNPGHDQEQVCVELQNSTFGWSPVGGGSSFSLTPNTGVATDSSGNLVALPEVGYQTSGGVTNIAWQEDTANGIFDPRRPINGHGGVNGGIDDNQAWQDVFDEAACWTAIQGGNQIAATIIFPPGIWQVGTPSSPTLTGGPGINYVGSPTGNSYGSVNMGGTFFLAKYSHVGVVSIISPYYVACSGDNLINVTNASISSNSLVLQGTNTASAGQVVYLQGLTGTGLTQLNGLTLTITAANPTQVSIGATAADVASTPQSGATAQPKHISGASGGSISNISVGGCNNINCVLPPGDDGSHPEYRANEIGINVGLTHTSNIGPLSASNTGGPGIRISGLDVVAQGPFTVYKTGAYWLGNPPNYDPSTDGLHGQIEFLSGDSRFFHFETYGDFSDPGTAYGHFCGVVLGGGNTFMSDGFVQLDQIGVCTENTGARIEDVRLDGMRGASILDSGFGNSWNMIYADGYCLSTTAKLHPSFDPTGTGVCDAIIPGGAGISTFDNVTTQRSFFDGESFKGSGDILQGAGFKCTNCFSLDTNADLQLDNSYDGIGGGNLGQNVVMEPLDQAVYNGKGIVLNGTTPTVLGHKHLEMQNGSATNITDLQDAYLQTDYRIALDSANDILVSTQNGGTFITCDNNNVVGPGLFDFVAIQTKASFLGGNQFLEVCPGINENYLQVNKTGGTLPATDSLSAVNTFGNIAVNPISSLPNGTFSQAGAASSFTYSWVTEVYVSGGKQTNTPQVTSHTPLATQTSGTNIYYHQSIPVDWTRYRIILQATTDPSFTVGTYYDVTAPSAKPQPAILDINLPLTVLTPVSGHVLLSSNIATNSTGTYVFDHTNIPLHSTSLGMPGQVTIDAAGGYIYYCTAEDTWSRAALTFNTSF